MHNSVYEARLSQSWINCQNSLETCSANSIEDVIIGCSFWLLYGERTQSSAIVFNHPQVFLKHTLGQTYVLSI